MVKSSRFCIFCKTGARLTIPRSFRIRVFPKWRTRWVMSFPLSLETILSKASSETFVLVKLTSSFDNLIILPNDSPRFLIPLLDSYLVKAKESFKSIISCRDFSALAKKNNPSSEMLVNVKSRYNF